MRNFLLILGLMIFGAGLMAQETQQKEQEEKKRIVIIRKSVDEEGNEVIEKIIREGEAAENFDWEEQEGDLIRLYVESGEEGDRGIYFLGDSIVIRKGEDWTILNEAWMEDLQERMKELHLDLEERMPQLFFFREGDEDSREWKPGGFKWFGPENWSFAFPGWPYGSENKVLLGVVVADEETGPGVVIREVLEESAAEMAGLQEDDVITAIDGRQVHSAEELMETVRSFQPGQSVVVDYRREGSAAQTTVTFRESNEPEKRRMYRF